MPSNKDNMPDNKDLEQLGEYFDEMGNDFEKVNENLDIKNITIEVDSMYCITPGCECGRELLPHDAERVADVTITFEVVIKNPEGVEKALDLDIVVSIGSTFNETINNPLTVSDTMN